MIMDKISPLGHHRTQTKETEPFRHYQGTILCTLEGFGALVVEGASVLW
jgi:hypothetical protein